MIHNASSAPLQSPARRMCRARVIRRFIGDLGAGVLACRAVRVDLHVSNIAVPFKPQPTLVYDTGESLGRYSHIPLISKRFP